MKPLRVAMLIVAVLAIGLVLVILRHGKSEIAYDIHQLHAEQLTLERQTARRQAASNTRIGYIALRRPAAGGAPPTRPADGPAAGAAGVRGTVRGLSPFSLWKKGTDPIQPKRAGQRGKWGQPPFRRNGSG